MKKILYSIVAFLSVFLFMTGCTDTETLMDDPSDRIVTFSANIGTSENSTRVELSQDYHSLDLNTYWEDGDELQIFVEQNRKVYEVGMVGISNISDDGKKASFSFQLPKEVDMNKYVKMYAFCGIEGELEQNYDGSWFASCQVDLTRSALVHFRAPMYCETMLEDVKNPDLVLFWHFGTYEVLHVENTSGSPISFSHYGYQVEVPWYQGSTHLRFDEEFQTTVLDGAWKGEAQSEAVNIPSGHTEEINSWYMPSGYMMHDAYLKGYINNKLIISSNKKSSNVKIEPGHAYHLYANWDGRILTFKDGDEEPERIIDVTPATIKLGPVVVGETKSADFVVSNEGEGDLTFQVESTHGLFDIPESGETFKLGEGEKKRFTVTFTPTEPGKEYSHTVAITSDAINGTKYVKITASTEEKPVNKAIIKLVPDEIDFGTVIVGESKTGQFKVSNDGNADLTFKVDDTHGDFDIAESGKSFTLGAGKQQTFTATFKPTEGGKEYSCKVAITSDADNGTQYLKLSGVSEEELIAKIIKLNPVEIDFGSVRVGESATEQFLVINDGATDLTFKVDDTHGDFDIAESGKSFTLGAGKQQTFTATFKPTEGDKDYSLTVTVTSNADNGSQFLKLSGVSQKAERINKVIPEDVLNAMESHINIYDGSNPPNIEGVFKIDGGLLKYDSSGSFPTDTYYTGWYMRFSNQDITKNTIDYEQLDWEYDVVGRKVLDDYFIGANSSISGFGNNFTVFSKLCSYDAEGDNVDYQFYSIVSGVKDAKSWGTGIVDVEIAWALVSEGKIVVLSWDYEDGIPREWPFSSLYIERSNIVSLPQLLSKLIHQ